MIDFRWLAAAAVLGGLSVALGAFGAHGLQGRVAPELLTVFETGARYHMYHALALVVVAVAAGRLPESALVTSAGFLFVAGIALFSGSLYAMTLTGIRTLGIVTPFGGVAFLAGWGALALAAWRAA